MKLSFCLFSDEISGLMRYNHIFPSLRQTLIARTRDLTFKFQTHIWPPLAPESVCFVSAFWWAAIVETSRGCLIDFAWKINASLNSIFVFVWYFVNTGANPTRWVMLNWCSPMTLPGIKKKKKDVTQKLLLELEQKSFLGGNATKQHFSLL